MDVDDETEEAVQWVNVQKGKSTKQGMIGTTIVNLVHRHSNVREKLFSSMNFNCYTYTCLCV